MKSQLRRFMQIIVLICTVFILATACNGQKITDEKFNGERNKVGVEDRGRVEQVSTHPSFVTQSELNTILASRSKNTFLVEGRVVSGVVPHHLVAGRLIADVMETLALQEPQRLILVGPNHFNKGGKIITGYNSWQAPNGVVLADDQVIKSLLQSGIAVRDEAVLAKEHSIGAVVPLLHHFLPKTKIVPIVLHHDVSIQEVDEILKALDPYLDKETVVLSSVDFSHYLTRSQAQGKDQETMRHMKNFDYPTIFRLGNDYLDSPASLSIAFRLAEKRGIGQFTALDNTNSGIILQNDFIETTSYFTLVFTEK